MDLFASQTRIALAPFFAGLNRSDSSPELWSGLDVQKLIALASVKPMGTDAASRALARLYLGNGREIIVQELMRRYPRSWESMPVAPLAYPRLWARSDSGAYASPASRYLVGDDKQSMKEGPATEAFDDVLDRARHDEQMQEAELRAMCGVRTVFAHVGWLEGIDGDPGRPLIHLYWPHDVVVLTLPTAPSEPESIVFVALRQTAPGKDETWLCYKRDVDADDEGAFALGSWQTTVFDSRQEAAAWTEYAGKLLPVVALRTEQPDGGFWPSVDHDALAQSIGLNVNRSNMEQVTDLQAHSLLTISADEYEEKEQPVGPDAVLKFRSGGSAQWLTPAPAFEAMRENIDEKQRAIATVRGNNPSAYSAKTSQPESGIARVIANLPHENRLKQLRPIIRRFDERVCRVVMDVADAYDDSVPLFGEGVRPRVELGATPTYEDPEAKQRMALIDLDMGVISPAEYAVQRGLYSSVAAATDDGLLGERRAAAVHVPDGDERQTTATPEAAAINVNEITLGIERLGRLGDIDGLNALRAKLADLLGAPRPTPITSEDLADEAEVVNEAMDGDGGAAEAVLDAAAELEPEDAADLDAVGG